MRVIRVSADDTTGRGHRLRDIEGRTIAFAPVWSYG